MKIYICGSACISPQETFNGGFPNKVIEYNTTRLNAIEPDYKEFVDPKLARRMSHVIKMGIATAKKTLAEAGVEQPGAIITGTAFGCVADTIAFISRMEEQQEELLPPTPFIQSTQNTVAAQIALLLQCHHYNFTYVHKGISFESALQDAMMLLKEGEAETVLAGATEEMADANFTVLTRLGLFKRKPVSNLDIFKEHSKGTIGGEGAAFFLLSNNPGPTAIAEFKAVDVVFKPVDIELHVRQFLSNHELAPDDIDLVITGCNGDTRNDAVYLDLVDHVFTSSAIAAYKHLCGEYPVSTSFALWLATNIIKNKGVPPICHLKGSVQAPKNILIYNHYQHKYHSLMLLSAI